VHSCLDLGTEGPAIFVPARAMSNGRTILALLIALAVALLPAAGGAGVKSPAPAGMSVMEDMPDCCPYKADPCEKAMDNCGTMATCALKCFSFAGTASSIIVSPSTFASITISFAANPLSSQTGSPPFRPPRA
jgi:hypothetical protein